jgi:hypothetical protein
MNLILKVQKLTPKYKNAVIWVKIIDDVFYANEIHNAFAFS